MSVTAIVTTYKREPEVVKNALFSIYNQTYPIDEIVLVDDNPFRNEYSKRICSMLSKLPFRVIYIKQQENNGNRGACAARNLGIQNSHSEYIAFLDDDDEWIPTKIEKQLEKFLYPQIGMVFCCGIIQQETEKGVRTFDYFTSKYYKQKVTHHDLLVYDYVGSTSNPLIRRECFTRCGLFDIDMPARQDYEMWIRISKKYEIVGLKDQLFIHKLHIGEQISSNSTKSINGYYLLYQKHKDEYKKDNLGRYAKMKNIVKLSYNKNPRMFIWACTRMIEARVRIMFSKTGGA